jgi:hypothetical protein
VNQDIKSDKESAIEASVDSYFKKNWRDSKSRHEVEIRNIVFGQGKKEFVHQIVHHPSFQSISKDRVTFI